MPVSVLSVAAGSVVSGGDVAFVRRRKLRFSAWVVVDEDGAEVVVEPRRLMRFIRLVDAGGVVVVVVVVDELIVVGSAVSVVTADSNSGFSVSAALGEFRKEDICTVRTVVGSEILEVSGNKVDDRTLFKGVTVLGSSVGVVDRDRKMVLY